MAGKKLLKPVSEIIQDYADHFACNKLHEIRIQFELIYHIGRHMVEINIETYVAIISFIHRLFMVFCNYLGKRKPIIGNMQKKKLFKMSISITHQ